MNLKQKGILNSPMYLLTDQMEITDPELADIERAFAGQLRHVILIRSNNFFLQAWNPGNDDRYLLKCREKGRECLTCEKTDLETVKGTFLAYFADDRTWRNAYRWKSIQHRPRQWVVRLLKSLAVVSVVLFVLNLFFWARSHRVHDAIVFSRDAARGDYEIRSADGAIQFGRNSVDKLLGPWFSCDYCYWYANGLHYFGVLPFLWLLAWAKRRELKRSRGAACRSCGIFVSNSTQMCPNCGWPYRPMSRMRRPSGWP